MKKYRVSIINHLGGEINSTVLKKSIKANDQEEALKKAKQLIIDNCNGMKCYKCFDMFLYYVKRTIF